MSLACDQTRVASYTFTHALNNHLFPGATDGHHNLTHHEPGEQPQVAEITNFCMGEFAVFLNELRSIPEGEGTLLDNCAILCCSEVSEGRTHSIDDVPVVLAGSAGGALRQGLHLRSYTQENVNKLMLTLVRSMGINLTSLGADDSFVTEGLTDLEV